MRKYSLIGFFGFILLGIGLAISYIQGKNDLFSIIPIVCGAIGITFYLLFDLKNIFSFLGSKGFRYGTNTFLLIVVFLAILIILQIIIADKNFRYDVTENKRFTLADQTLKVLANLSGEIKIFAFVDKRDLKAKDLLEQYRNVSKKISYELADPNLQPGLAKQYQITAMNTLVLSSGLKQEKISDISEEKLTNALIKLTRDGQKTIYFVEGHGEKRIEDSGNLGISSLKEELVKQNYQLKSLLLLQKSEIPKDASVVVIPGIQKNLLPEEEKLIDQYLKNGGRVLFLVDPDTSKEVKDFLGGYGIRPRDDIIVDKLSRAFGGDFLLPVVTNYDQTPHPITENLRAMTFFPLASSLEIMSSEKRFTEVLAQTTPESWGESNKELVKQGKAGFETGDTAGPLTIAALTSISLEKQSPEEQLKTGKLIVFGDSDFVTNGNISLSGNGDFILNTLNWLAEEDDLIAIRPKDLQQTPLFLNQTQGRLLFWINLIFLPLLVVLAGIILLSRRRIKTT